MNLSNLTKKVIDAQNEYSNSIRRYAKNLPLQEIIDTVALCNCMRIQQFNPGEQIQVMFGQGRYELKVAPKETQLNIGGAYARTYVGKKAKEFYTNLEKKILTRQEEEKELPF